MLQLRSCEVTLFTTGSRCMDAHTSGAAQPQIVMTVQKSSKQNNISRALISSLSSGTPLYILLEEQAEAEDYISPAAAAAAAAAPPLSAAAAEDAAAAALPAIIMMKH